MRQWRWWFSDEYSGTGNNTSIESSNQDFCVEQSGICADSRNTENIFQGHYVACDADSHLTLSPISAVAGAYGLKTVQIHSNEELQERVKETLDYDGPVICEVMVPIDLSAFPKQVSYKRSDGQMESLPLEYMNPPLEQEEFEQDMLIPLYEMK